MVFHMCLANAVKKKISKIPKLNCCTLPLKGEVYDFEVILKMDPWAIHNQQKKSATFTGSPETPWLQLSRIWGRNRKISQKWVFFLD